MTIITHNRITVRVLCCWTLCIRDETQHAFHIKTASYCINHFGWVYTGGETVQYRCRHFSTTRPSLVHRKEKYECKPGGSTFLTTVCALFLRLHSPFWEDFHASSRKDLVPAPAGDLESQLAPVVSRPHLAGLVCWLDDAIVSTAVGSIDLPESETCQAMFPPHLQVRH